ncbi:unnamed protein product, partial [marine sediment metagenome]
YFVSNIDYNKPSGIFQQMRHSLNIIYSLESKKKIDNLLKKTKPDLIHLNNFAHQISPSILGVIKKYRIPTVMTMRDYKMVCPSYSMFVNGNPCGKCKNGKYYFCFLKKCTKGSLIKSLVNVFEMYLHHKLLHIYDKIDIYISPSMFLMKRVKEMGFNAKVVYLPNFVDIERYKPYYGWKEESIIYTGRLSPEKGLVTLINAIKEVNISLNIIGDGPIKEKLINKVENEKITNVNFLGYKKGEELKNEIKKSMFLVLPS